jgi:hypothetical protein
MNTYASKTLKELFELYATTDSDFIKDGSQREIQHRINTAINQLDKCRTKEEAMQVYEAFLDI